MDWFNIILLCLVVGIACWFWGKSANQQEQDRISSLKRDEETKKQETQNEIKKQRLLEKEQSIPIIKDCLIELNQIHSKEFCYGMYEAIKYKYLFVDSSNKKLLKQQIKSILQLNNKKSPRK